MKIEGMKVHLEAIYIDYFDGFYSGHQLKQMLTKLYCEANIPIDKWSELILDSQWKHATEQDYEEKRQQIYL